MLHKVNYRRARASARSLRLKIAQWVAPAGADIHDPDDTACPEAALLLAAVFYGDIKRRDSKDYIEVTEHLDELVDRYNLVERTDNGWPLLTDAGEHELGRRWGTDRVPRGHTEASASVTITATTTSSPATSWGAPSAPARPPTEGASGGAPITRCRPLPDRPR